MAIVSTRCETLETSDYAHLERSQQEDSTVCESKQDGIYADYASDCKKFFVCEKNQIFNFDCPTSTRFYERFESCSFVPPEELEHFVCNNPNQLKDAATGHRQSLHREGHSVEFDDTHIVDRRHDGVQKVKSVHAIDIKDDRDLDYLKQILRDNQWFPTSSHIQGGEDDFMLMQQSEAERRNKFRNEKEEEDFHPKSYQIVPIKGHEYRDHRVLESILSPLLRPKPTRVSKKLTPCQKAASSRRNDRKSKRFERSVKCVE